LGDGGEHVAERAVDRSPVAALELLPTLVRQQSGKPEVGLTPVDELLLAIGNRLGGILCRRQVERLAVFQKTGDSPNAEPKGSPQHRYGYSAPHDGAGFVGGRLAAIIVVSGFYGCKPDPEGAPKFEKAATRKAVTRGLGGSLVDLSPNLLRQI
jgi:hypothetical protein